MSIPGIWDWALMTIKEVEWNKWDPIRKKITSNSIIYSLEH